MALGPSTEKNEEKKKKKKKIKYEFIRAQTLDS
jgi:hypothetical protein